MLTPFTAPIMRLVPLLPVTVMPCKCCVLFSFVVVESAKATALSCAATAVQSTVMAIVANILCVFIIVYLFLSMVP